ncbi:transcriptional regulator [Amycolatopsis orientalis]|uniref:Transcriptional regulator n=1 Tax=Amycolatopsis orientalis TaxID=31958 RepID=A0A193BQ66_AMYOR|nr:TetR/AcrR family transcriptional regulator [Amycolatopsis orientalis]ANN14332.1 transcriptional regulator [Amycolatopsis orientalis]
MAAERADAARNRRAILRATEELLAEHGLEYVSMERVAAAAGVGKGTVFHRFTNRAGLMTALIEERMRAHNEAFTAGPPPLGPGAPPRERLTAFFDAVIAVATKNVALMAAFENSAKHRHDNDLYVSWHKHVSGLIAEARPDLDAEVIAHVLLGSLRSELVAHLLKSGESARLADALRSMVDSLLGQLRRT